MSSFILKKGDLSTYLKRLKDKFELLVPCAEDGVTQFRTYTGSEEIDWQAHTRVSVKSLLMPQRELMFSYSTRAEEGVLKQTLAETQTIVFGVKPCDARAMTLNALMMTNDEANTPQDIYFKTRRQNTLLIGYGCAQPGTACFCHAVGGNPFGHAGLDALITDLGDQLLLTLTADRPSANMLVQKDLMEEAGNQDLAEAQRISKAALEMMLPEPKLEKPAGDIKSLFDLPVWEETAQRCLNCGICTYLCPTCTCFDIVDQVVDGCGNYFRCWDSCMFSLFTQHASGHNPRPGKKERLRQRFMHKLHYFPERHGDNLSCVGCGRCILHCPVNIDIREISKQMA